MKLDRGQFAKALAGQYAVRFHTTNYRKRIMSTSNTNTDPISANDYTVYTNEWFAPRIAKALRRASELCGARRSSF
jgi:hypothetical protein